MIAAADTSPTARILRGLLAGAVAGVVASFAMDPGQALLSALSDDARDAEPATSKAADRMAQAIVGQEVPVADKPLAGQGVHYAVGVLLGAAYGVAAEFRPSVTAGFGTALALGSAALLDEAAVPALGFSPPPWKTPPATHLYAVASHLVFGGVAELVRRSVDATLRPASRCRC